MKKIFYILASAIVALGAMACQNEVDESINPNEQSDVVSFTVAFDEATRIAMSIEDKTAKFAFEAGDVLYVQPRATLENDEVFVGNTYEFTTEDGKTFSCQSAELVSELAQSGNYANVDSSADGSIRSNEGVDGFNFATYADLTAETVTLPMSHAVFHFTVPEGTTATLKHTEDIFDTEAVVGWEKEMTFTEGEHWVAAWTFEGTLSYSINGVVVKSIEKDFEAGKIYNLGTLGYEFTTITTKEQLIAFAEHVNAGNNYKDKTVKLGQSIDLEGEILAPIGNSKANAFRGNFDGQGNTISNFTVEHAEVAGLFGMLAGGSIKNLNVNKATIYGNSYAGGIVAWVQATSYQGWQGAADAVVDNCNVTYTEITSTVINNDNAAKVGGIAGYVVYGTISNSTVANTNITAYRDMGGIAGMANFASSNGKGAVISGNTVGENVTITVDNSTNYNNYTTADQYNVASIVGRISTGAIVENNTGEATIVLPKTAVEKLNEQIADGGTITLTENIVAGENEKIIVPAGKTVTLDLNGHTISQEKVCTASHELICNNGDLTITGEGTISFKDNSEGDPTFGWGSYTIRNTGNLTIENGTIEHLTELNNGSVVHMYCAVFSYSGNVVINGGTFKSVDYRSVRAWSGSLTINGGNFEGQIWIQPTKANFDLNITGGTFAPRGVDGSSVFVENATHTVDVEITGGTFTTKLGASKAVKGWVKGGQFKVDPSAYVAEGYKAIENEGVWTVKTWNPVASVSGVEYEKLADALTAAGTTKVITLLVEDQTINNACVISKESKAFKVADGFLSLKNYDNANGDFDVVKVSTPKTWRLAGTFAGVNKWDISSGATYMYQITGTNVYVVPNVAIKSGDIFKFFKGSNTYTEWVGSYTGEDGNDSKAYTTMQNHTKTNKYEINNSYNNAKGNFGVTTNGNYNIYIEGTTKYEQYKIWVEKL